MPELTTTERDLLLRMGDSDEYERRTHPADPNTGKWIHKGDLQLKTARSLERKHLLEELGPGTDPHRFILTDAGEELYRRMRQTDGKCLTFTIYDGANRYVLRRRTARFLEWRISTTIYYTLAVFEMPDGTLRYTAAETLTPATCAMLNVDPIAWKHASTTILDRTKAPFGEREIRPYYLYDSIGAMGPINGEFRGWIRETCWWKPQREVEFAVFVDGKETAWYPNFVLPSLADQPIPAPDVKLFATTMQNPDLRLPDITAPAKETV